jgi:hypothetical protein
VECRTNRQSIFMWSAGRIDSPSLIVLKMRTAFEMRCQPANVISRVWNVIDGERNGIRVLIFDSTVFEGKGRYCTFVATLTSENLFESDSSREKIAQCSGWTAAYRIRFIQIPWTLSITRIEELLNNLYSWWTPSIRATAFVEKPSLRDKNSRCWPVWPIITGQNPEQE